MTTLHEHVWRHDERGLSLVLGERVATVPFPLDAMLAGLDGVGLSPAPAVDVLRVESQLRHLLAVLGGQAEGIERRVVSIRRSVEDQVPGLPLSRRDRRALAATLLETVENHAQVTLQARRARKYLLRLREFVAAAEPTSGWLHEAVAGWARGTELPASATVFDSEDRYLDADPRRAGTTDSGVRRIDGIEQWGQSWRRDGDDDDPAAVDDGLVHRDGPWSIGYIPRTRELYAIRRAAHLPREVWAFGVIADTGDSASDLYGALVQRMREPNSIVLVATTAARATRRWE